MSEPVSVPRRRIRILGGVMKLYAGKWFVALRLKDDRCFGVGRPPKAFLENADMSRPSRGV